MDSNIKLSNVIGAPFQDYVLKQMYTRAGHNSSTDRTLEEVLFLANKTAWVRLASSVNVIGRRLENVENNKTATYKDVTTNEVYKALGVGGYKNEEDLAKLYVLEAGTSLDIGNGIFLRSGIGPLSNASDFTNSTLASYGLGGTQELGYVPMPGLTSITVDTLGRLGSLRQATINFRANNLNQLNVIEALYFRLGYSMILEWGHTQYYTNGKAQEPSTFKKNSIYGIGDPFDDSLRKEEVIKKINAKTKETDGNYGGMYGIVTGFTWSATQDGGYDCTLKLQGHGAIMDSLKINQAYTLPKGTIKQYLKYEDALRLQQEKIAAKYAADEAAKTQGQGGAPATNPYPVPKNIHELYDAIKSYKYSTDASFTFEKFVQLYGWPIPDTKSFIQVPEGLGTGNVNQKQIEYQLDLRANQEDFAIFIDNFEGYSDTTTKAFLEQRYLGVWINQNGKFLHFPTTLTSLTADLNIKAFDYPLGSVVVPDYSNGSTSLPDFLTLDELKALPPREGQVYKDYYNSLNLPNLIVNQGLYFTFPSQDIPLKSTFTAETAGAPSLLPDVARDPQYSIVKSRRYGNVGRYETSVTVSPGSVYSNAYLPTTADIAQALEAYLKPIYDAGGTIPVNLSVTYHSSLPSSDKFGGKYNSNRASAFRWHILFNASFEIDVPNVDISETDPAVRETTIKNSGKTKNEKVKITIITSNPYAFSNYKVNNASAEVVPPTATKLPADGGKNLQQVDPNQVDAPEGFSSALQAMLTIVQTNSQYNALNKTGVIQNDILALTNDFYKDGALKGVIDLASKDSSKTSKPRPMAKGKFDLLNYALVGFNAAAMADESAWSEDIIEDFNVMCTAIVIKYKQSGLEGEVAAVRSPTYISLGYLLAFLNNMCLIYDSNQSRKLTTNAAAQATPTDESTRKYPFIYIDFNSKTNFCFTSPQQFSIDPTICMIPINCPKADYEQLFPSAEIVKNLAPPLFDTVNHIPISKDIENIFPFKASDPKVKDGAYRGYLMDILLNTQYLLDLCTQLSRNDPENSINLKPFLDQILIDVNKCLGGVNSFRVSYIDESNVIQIVDDQWVANPEGRLSEDKVAADKATTPTISGELPLDKGSVIPSADAPGQISIVGTKSLTRELRFNTTISSKLASKIAISAQAETGSVNSKDHSSYSHLNVFYEDRYSRSKEDPTRGNESNTAPKGKGKGKSSDQQAADLFNTHVSSLYYDINAYSPKKIEAAKNYYLERMSKVKSSNPLTSASPYVSLELEMTMDGISGILMGNAFTIPNNRLPYTYQGDNGKTKIAFIVTGLTHTVQSNEWLTKIKGQMIKLKKPVLIATAATQTSAIQAAIPASLTSVSDFVVSKPWSAAFISYIMKQAGVTNFPFNESHTGYAQALRNNSIGFQLLDPGKNAIAVGDVIVANRSGNNMTFSTNPWYGYGHGDIVISTSATTAEVIGGNVSNSVGKTTLTLTDGRLGKSDYYLILRPPSAFAIADLATAAHTAWKDGKLKETQPEAYPFLKAYYGTVGIKL